MLLLSKQQLAQFREHAIGQFTDGAVVYLRLELPRQTHAMAESALWSFVRSGVDLAASCGIHNEHNVLRFLRWILAGDHLRAHAALYESSLTGYEDLEEYEKLDLFEQRDIR